MITRPDVHNVFPSEIAEVIKSHYAVKDCIVIGVQIAENDTIPMAFIEFEAQGMDKGTALETIKAGCCEKLKDYECLKFFRVIERPRIKKTVESRTF